MTKAKAQALSSELIERKRQSTWREITPEDYVVTMHSPQGLTSGNLTTIEAQFAVTSTVKLVEFS